MKLNNIIKSAVVVLLAASVSSPALAGKDKKKEQNSIFSGQVLKDRNSTSSFGAVFRRDGGVNKNRRIDRGRGSGFELGFDGHSGGK